jgi:hypothetical protein
MEISCLYSSYSGKDLSIRAIFLMLAKGFHTAAEDIGANGKFVVYSGTENYPLSNQTEAIGLMDFLHLLEKGAN